MKIKAFLLRFFCVAVLIAHGYIATKAASVSTVLGHNAKNTDDGFLPSVGLGLPAGVFQDKKSNLFYVDKAENVILIVRPDGYKKVFAGSGVAGLKDGDRLSSQFKRPHGIVQDSKGNFFITDSGNNVIRKISTDGFVSVFAGSGASAFQDGSGEKAAFRTPMGIDIDVNDNLYVADQRNHLIRKISPDAEVTTIAGTPERSGFIDGSEARFSHPESVVVASSGEIYVADRANHKIRVIDTDLNVKTLDLISNIKHSGKAVGKPESPGKSGDKSNNGKGNSNGHNNAEIDLADLKNPSDLAIDSQGRLFVVDSGNHSIKMIDKSNNITLIAGDESGFWDASNTSYQESFFDEPYCIFINSNDELIISDLRNYKIRKINLKEDIAVNLVDTLIGSGEAGYQDGEYYNATIRNPHSLAFDKHGNLYFTDLNNNFIRKLSPKGSLTTIAGTGNQGFIDGGATDSDYPAVLSRPHSLVVNSSGEIIFTDRNNHSIRKIDSQGNVKTIAGVGKQGYKDGSAHEAEFNFPSGLAIDSKDNVYIADTNNHRIRLLTTDGNVTTISGTRKGYSSGNINFARFDSPSYLAVDNSGNIYVSDRGNHKIRRISSNGQVTTIAGIGKGYQDGPGKMAQFNEPSGLLVHNDYLYVADFGNNRIRTVNLKTSVVETLAGSGISGYKDGNDSLVSFKGPISLALNDKSELIVADSNNNRIRKIQLSLKPVSNTSKAHKKYYVTTIAGNLNYDLVDGYARFSSFRDPSGVVQDSIGNLFVVDRANHVIRKISKDGEVSVFAGTGIAGLSDGNSLKAQFSNPRGLAIDKDDNLYVADTGNHSIRKVTPMAEVTTIAGTGNQGNDDGPSHIAQFNRPYGIALDSQLNVYVADRSNHRIRKITKNGIVSTVAGSKSGFNDGSLEYAKFNSPHGLYVDEDDAIYVADFGNNRIRKIIKDQVITVAGSGAASFLDGEASQAQFSGPIAITQDSSGNLYVSDSNNNKIRKINSKNIVSTLAGMGAEGALDGLARKSTFSSPAGLIMDKDALIVVDSSNNVIRKIYKTSDYAKSVLGFSSVSEEPDSEIESGAHESNTRPVVKLATDVGFHSNNKSIPTFTLGTDLELKVFAFDLEDEDAIHDSVTWESSYQGLLGLGTSMNIKDLKIATHHITVTVKDSGNLSTSVSFDLQIIPFVSNPPVPVVTSQGQSSGESSSKIKESIVLKITTDENRIFRANKLSRFNAAAFDLTEDFAQDISSKIKWSSSINGNLGRGPEVRSKLSRGTHVITASLGDYSDSITVEVLGANAQRKKTPLRVEPKPKTFDELKLPELEMETIQPKDHDPEKRSKPGQGSDSVGIKDVKIKLL
jgi:sugar lactone lactonase YvrE